VVLPAGTRPWQCRVGVDLTSVAEVSDAVGRLGDRYLERIYTPHELACCTGTAQVVAEGLAARFAAKEAVLKALRPVGARPPWLSIEVRRVDGGACGIRLSGSARRLAAEAGITEVALSMTHETYWAVAVVVALCDDTIRLNQSDH
jgi:holo-[acyl-carrier protein] synthase